MATQTSLYKLDSRNRIIAIGGSWDDFADENGGVEISAQDVIGRQIEDYIKGDITTMWVNSIFQYARILGKTVERPYRCDSPDLKRFMRMRVVPEQGGAVLSIEHELISTEQRSAPLHIRYGTNIINGVKLKCSVCGRLNIDGWNEPQGCHAGTSGEIVVVYTVCEDCYRLIPVTSENRVKQRN